MSEQALPRSQKDTVYRVGRWESGRRTIEGRPTHVFKVERVRIGTSYDGGPVWTEYADHNAIGCGVYLQQSRYDEGIPPEAASCAKCRRKYIQLVGRQPGNQGGRRS